mgnify:CR=1 FL=1
MQQKQKLKISIGPIRGEENGCMAIFALCLVVLAMAAF